jgi:hypothetical protein
VRSNIVIIYNTIEYNNTLLKLYFARIHIYREFIYDNRHEK